MRIAVDILIILLLSLAAVQDFKTRMVSDVYTFGFCAAAIFVSPSILSGVVAIGLIAFTIISDDKIKAIGGADILVFAGLTARFGVDNIFMIIIITCSVLLAAHFLDRFNKNRKYSTTEGIACMPFFLLSFFILRIII